MIMNESFTYTNKYINDYQYFLVDTNECASNPCQNDGICVDGRNEYTCLCQTGFLGNNCQTGNGITAKQVIVSYKHHQ